jgi:hypothetical protein
MLEILKETTVWNTDSPVPNHTYLLDGDKLVAYAKFGSDEIVISKTQIKISKRYRTFVRDYHVGLNTLIPKRIAEAGVRTFKINSKEKEYFVTLKEKSNTFSCTCTGFQFRGKCKHIDAVVAKIQQPSA